MRRKKAFDCVEMKRKAQEKIYAETKHLSRDEIVDYFRRQLKTGPFAHLWKRSRKANVASGGSR